MKNFLIVAICFFALGASIEELGFVGHDHAKSVLPYREGKLLVRINSDSPDDSLNAIADGIGATAVESFTLVPGLWLYEFNEDVDVKDAISVFQTSDQVVYVEPDYVYSVAAVNDPRFAEQWPLENTGQSSGVADADINANSMWAIEDGDPSVVIGVIDTGVDYRHTDLAANMWQNPLEIANNAKDDDNNGYIDDVYGINAIINSGNPIDDNSHGTHVSGTIGARGNNAIGVSGVAQQVKIAGCKFLDASGSGSTSNAIKCLQYFAKLKSRANRPVNLIATNNSWGGASYSLALQDAIKAHQDLGILFVAAAGNSTNNNDTTPSYPANYALSNVIAVAATDASDRLATFSNYGPTTVHVGAPGARVLSTVRNNSYAFYSGTSMAAPHVTGLVAVIKSKFSTLDFKSIRNLLIASGTPLGSLQSKTISGRRIRGADTNGRGALTCSGQIVDRRLKPTTTTVNIQKGQSVALSALRINCANALGALSLYSDNQENVALSDSGTNGDALANDGIASFTWQPKAVGTYALNFGNGDIVTVTVK